MKTAAALVTFAALAALTGCSESPEIAAAAKPIESVSPAIEPTTPPKETPPKETPPDDEFECTADTEASFAYSAGGGYSDGDAYGEFPRIAGELRDMGVNEFANGEITRDNAGQIVTYTIAAGDTIMGIAERLCVDWQDLKLWNYGNRVDAQKFPIVEAGATMMFRPGTDD